MKRKLMSVLLMIAIMLSVVATMPMTSSADDTRIHRCGDADGNGAITISDALEILIFLAGMPSVINTNPQARIAASGATRAFVEGQNVDRRAATEPNPTPTIVDALEILIDLAGMASTFKAWLNANCDGPSSSRCKWCGSEASAGVAPVIAALSPFNATVGSAYTHTFVLSAGDTPVTWSITGNLPAGLSFNTTTGQITGTPLNYNESTSFTIRAENTTGYSTREFTLTVNAPGVTNSEPPITTEPPPATTLDNNGNTQTQPEGTTPADTTQSQPDVTTTPGPNVTTTPAPATTPGVTTTPGITTTRAPTSPQETAPVAELTFSHRPGLYTRGFQLTLTAPEDAEIWYTFSSANAGGGENNTLSGATFAHTALGRHEGGVSPVQVVRDDRGRWRSNGTLHPNARRLMPGETINVLLPSQRSAFTVSAVTVTGGVVSQPVTNSYIRGLSGDSERYWANNEFMVFVLYSDALHFLDADNGVFGTGRDRLQWVETYRSLPHITRSLADILRAMDDHMTQGAYPPTLPANFTRRGRGAAEVPVNIEMFDPHRNNQRINQRAGMRVKGGWSRGTFVNEQKTLEFYAREGFGDRDNFLFPMFGNVNSIDGNLMHRYERFRLRNGGSDREQTYLRDEFAYTLAQQAGYIDTYDFRPAVVFLNGNYYGLAWMRTARTENHWRRLYQGGARENGFEQIGSNEMGRASCGRHSCSRANGITPEGQRTTLPSAGGIPERAGPVVCTDANPCNRPAAANFYPCEWYWASFNDHCEELGRCRGTWRTYRNVIGPNISGSGSWEEVVRLATGTYTVSGSTINMDSSVRVSTTTPNGLTNDLAWARFQQLVCLDDLMRYYALNIFGANVDWPSNNVELWRYYLNDRERAEIAAGTSTLHPNLQDEKWRFVAHDMEMGWGIWQAGSPVPSASHQNDNTIWALLNRPGSARAPEIGNRVHYNATQSASYMIPALMQRPENRARLANAISDLVESSHSSANMVREHARLRGYIQIEHTAMLAANGSATRRISELSRSGEPRVGPGWPLAADIYNATSTESQATLTNFIAAAGRPTTIQSHVQASLGLSWASRYAVSLSMSAQGGHVIMNNRPVGVHGLATTDPRSSRTATGRYFAGAPVPIKPVAWPGWRIAGVTGATRVGTTDVWTVTGAATVVVNFERDPTVDPREIIEVGVRGTNQYIVIRNNSAAAVNMNDYFMTDDGTSGSPENLNKWAFPAGISIPANGTIRVGFRDSTATSVQATADFNLDFGERLRLVRGAGDAARVVQLVEVARPETDQIMQRGIDGIWRITGARSPYVPPHDPPCCDRHPNCECSPALPDGMTASWSETGVQITGIPESESWTISNPVDRWPPSGGPWGNPPGTTFTYAGGVLTITGNGRGGWGPDASISWGYW